MSKQYLVMLQGDTNDGDYITSTYVVDDAWINRAELIVNKCVNVSREREPNNFDGNFAVRREFKWCTSEYGDQVFDEYYPDISDDDICWLDAYMPYGEFGIHTASVAYYLLANADKISL